MICKTNAQVIIQGGGGGGDDMVLYHVTQTISGNNCTLSLTTYNGEATDNYWVGTKTTGNTVELFLVDENGTPVTLVTKTITSNGTYNAQTTDSADGYSEVVVDVPQSSPSFGYLIATDNGEYDAEDTQFDGWSHVSVGVVPALVSMTITQNGTYRASDELVEGWDEITVNVPSASPTLVTKSITTNGTYNASSDSADGYSTVNVSVAPNVAATTITSNGTYSASASNLDGFSSVTVSVPSTLKTLLDATRNASRLFYDYQGSDISNLISYNDTTNVINMSNMFYNCDSLIAIPNLNVSNVKNMQDMFTHCGSLVNANISGLSNVENMEYMFQVCSNLVSAELHNTNSLTTTFYMFSSCSNLQSITIDNMSNVTNAAGMFNNCSSLAQVRLTNLKASLDISASTQFTQSALVNLLNDLGTVSSTKTLTMGATNLAKLTSAQRAIATNKGWTLA